MSAESQTPNIDAALAGFASQHYGDQAQRAMAGSGAATIYPIQKMVYDYYRRTALAPRAAIWDRVQNVLAQTPATHVDTPSDRDYHYNPQISAAFWRFSQLDSTNDLTVITDIGLYAQDNPAEDQRGMTPEMKTARDLLCEGTPAIKHAGPLLEVWPRGSLLGKKRIPRGELLFAYSDEFAEAAFAMSAHLYAVPCDTPEQKRQLVGSAIVYHANQDLRTLPEALRPEFAETVVRVLPGLEPTGVADYLLGQIVRSSGIQAGSQRADQDFAKLDALTTDMDEATLRSSKTGYAFAPYELNPPVFSFPRR